MNLRPTEIPQVDGDQSRYSLVIAVAKRARQISEEAEKKGEIIVEKPVDLAVQDMMKHRYAIIPAPEEEEEKEEEEVKEENEEIAIEEDSDAQ